MVKLFVGSAVLLGYMMQMPSTPPMKMGLWSTTSTTTMSMPGMQMPQGAGNRTTKVRSCMTPESYAKDVAEMQSQQRDCTRSNESWTGNGFSFDISCPKTNATGHFKMTWSNDSGHGTLHLEMSPGGRSMVMDTTLESHYVGADCGSVKPGSPEVQP
jgi:Protein of unknown function (DUF3617)